MGAVMLKPQIINEILEVLEVRDFYAEKHRKIFKVMLELSSENNPIDLVSVTSHLKTAKLLD